MRSRSILSVAAACASLSLLAACSGLKEALTAHVDVVARAGSQELSVTRLGDLLGKATIPVQINHETAAIVADIWTGLQQMGYAAAHNDSLNDANAVDVALGPLLNEQRVQKYMDSVTKSFKVDSGTEAEYDAAAGGLLAARHILIGYKNPTVPPTQTEKDSLRKKAEMVRAQVTPQNFAEMVKKYSTDPTAGQNQGNLHVFEKGAMIPQFSAATAALKPGEISQPIETQYGFHIIQRLPYADAQKDFTAQYAQVSMQKAESTFVAKLEDQANIQVKDNAPVTIKDAVREPDKHYTDTHVLATYNGGKLTVANFFDWLESNAQGQTIMQRIPTAPDSVLKPFAKQLALQNILLAHADSARIDVSQDQNTMHATMAQLVKNVWQALGVDPAALADSGKTPEARERLAASRVDGYLDRMMSGQAQVINLPLPLKRMVNAKYPGSINTAGLDRAVDVATKVHASADSARAASQPKSQIPLPGAPGQAPAGAGQAQPSAPPVSTKPATPAPPTKKP